MFVDLLTYADLEMLKAKKDGNAHSHHGSSPVGGSWGGKPAASAAAAGMASSAQLLPLWACLFFAKDALLGADARTSLRRL